MKKRGRFKKLNNFVFGWFFQGVLSLQKEEFVFRVVIELLFYIIIGIYLFCSLQPSRFIIYFFLCLLVIHTLFWFMDDAFWVYMLLSFDKMKNPGFLRLMSWAEKVRSKLWKHCDLIIIVGSICRHEFHDKSDMDLMAIRKRGLMGLLAYPMAVFVRAHGFFMRIPFSLYIFKDIEALNKNVRKDERPIIVYKEKYIDYKKGIKFEEFDYNKRADG